MPEPKRFMLLKEALKNKKMNNKGAAIVLVIVAMAFIGILATMILWMSYMNYLMKITDKKATDNFYSAEQIAEEIKVGLTNDAAEAAAEAYNEVLQQYTAFDNNDERQSYFEVRMIKDMKNALMGADVDHYDLDKIKGYVEDRLLNPASPASTSIRAVTLGNASNAGAGDNPIWSVSTNSILIKDVHVRYTDSKGYVSVIHTDFRVAAPKIDFSSINSTPEALSYALIANNVAEGRGTTTINGSVYAGSGKAGKEAHVAEDSIVIGDGSHWTFSGGDRLVAQGGINLGLNSTLNTSGVDLWAENVSLDGNNSLVNMTGSSYVADDLTVNGKNATVELAGSYYGYGIDLDSGNDTDDNGANSSSSILINGRGTSIDFTGLDKLWVGGRSYIGTSILGVNNRNIGMSESVAVKGDQIAYLAPSDAVKRLSGEANVTSNPVSKSEYESSDIPANLQNKLFVNNVLEKTLINGLNSDTPTGKEKYIGDYASGFQTIFVPKANGEYMVYIYLVMKTSADANKYFNDYYGVQNNQDRLNKYVKLYAKDNGIKLSKDADYTRFEMAGNYFSYEGDTVSLNKATEDAQHASEALLYTRSHKALSTKLQLSLDSCTSAEQDNTVFENIVDTGAMTHYLGASGTLNFEDTDSGYKAVVTNGSYNYNGDDKLRLILAGGDITINSNFTGTAIANGKIMVSSGAGEIICDSTTKSQVESLMGKKDKTNKACLYEFFRDANGYKEDSGDSGDASSDNMVVYENWTKR